MVSAQGRFGIGAFCFKTKDTSHYRGDEREKQTIIHTTISFTLFRMTPAQRFKKINFNQKSNVIPKLALQQVRDLRSS